jgi:hypothetical protein
MVASVDLTRYEPPLDYLLRRIDLLTQLIEHGVDLGFVREEATTVLHELSAFCRRRINFAELETRIREATTIDVAALGEAVAILEKAPRDDLAPEGLTTRFGDLREQVQLLAKEQHTMSFQDVGLRLELLFELIFQNALLSIVDTWDPAPLVQLTRKKMELRSEQRQRDLWSRVLGEFRQFDPERDDDEEVVRAYTLEEHGVLPKGFLESSPPDVADRLARYHAWLRGRVLRAMKQHGRNSSPMPLVGLAKILAAKHVDVEPSTTEIVVARAVSNIAGWLAHRGERPLSVEQFGALLGLHADSKLLGGEEQQAFKSRKWEGKASPEYAALHSFRTLARATAALHENETPLGIALFQYKAGVELFAPKIASAMSKDELILQKELCKFLLERGIFSVGTKFGQHETDLVANVRDDFIVIEAKVIKTAPNPTKLAQNLMQLLRYDDLNPAFRGSRAVLIVYNFTDVPIMTTHELVAGRAWIVAVNAKAGPPSKTKRCLKLMPDAAQGLLCVDVAASPKPKAGSKKKG